MERETLTSIYVTVRPFFEMITTPLALSALVRIRKTISAAYEHKLSEDEVTALKRAIHLLSTAVIGDAQAMDQVAWLEHGLKQDLLGDWPGCQKQRVTAMLDAHALSGYILGC